MKLQEARAIADEIILKAKPYCDRIKIAGSVLREKPEVGDIEIVCIPKYSNNSNSLFNDEKAVDENYIKYVDSFEKIRGLADGKYACRKHPSGINIDFFMANEENWGYILAIRTGSAEFSHKVLARNWVKKGYMGSNGYLTVAATGKRVILKEEKDLFDLLDMKYIKPTERNM